MATWVPINGLAIQLAKNAGGAAAADYYLKFYDEGTTTPASMATDSTGGTTLDKCKLDSNGLAVNGSDDPFIPHIDRNYKLVCYTNATDADNNATGSAFFVIDNVKFAAGDAGGIDYTPEGTNASTISIATYLDKRVLDNVAALRAYEPVVDEENVWILGHTTEGIGGGAFYYDESDTTSTDNNGAIIVTTGGARWKRPKAAFFDAAEFGALEDNGTTSNNTIIRAALTYAASIGSSQVTLRRQTETGWFGLEQINGTSVIKLVSNVDFIGVGKPELRPIVDTDTFMVASIFMWGNYHPDFYNSVSKESVTLTEGSDTITVADSSIYAEGSLIFTTSQTSYLAAGFPVYTYMKLVEVTEIINATSIRISEYLEFGGAGYVANAENNGTNGRFSEPLFILRDARVKGFKVKTLGHIGPDSGTYNCELSDIEGEARTGIFGNTFVHTKFRDWDITCYNRFSEMSFCSHNNDLKRIKYSDGGQGLADNIGMSWQESGSYNTLDGFEMIITGGSVSNPLRIQDHDHSVMKNGVVKMVGNTNAGVIMRSSATANVGDIKSSGFDNVTFVVDGVIPIVVDALNEGTNNKLYRCFATNIKYRGDTPTQGVRLQGVSGNDVTKFTTSVECEGTDIPLTLLNASDNDLTLKGDFDKADIETELAAESGNSVRLLSAKRTDLRAIKYVQTIDVSVSTTTSGNVVRTITIPAGAMELSDSIEIDIAYSTSGVLGNKNLEIGLLDSTSTFQGFSVVAGNNYNAQARSVFSLRTKTLMQVAAFGWTKVPPSNPVLTYADRVGPTILDSDSNDITLQIRAWVDSAGDGLNINSLDVKVYEGQVLS